jgi:uncharacterized protein (DUF433 family)
MLQTLEQPTLEQSVLSVSPEALSESRLSLAQLKRLAQYGLISAHPKVVHGAVVFTRTRVPVYNLWDYLDSGDSIDDFLDSFPTVTREQAKKALALR